jgi:hypothetical protein
VTGAGRGAPDGLARADVAYLTARYKTDSEARKLSQQSHITSRMTEMLLKTNESSRLARGEDKTSKTSAGR